MSELYLEGGFSIEGFVVSEVESMFDSLEMVAPFALIVAGEDA